MAAIIGADGSVTNLGGILTSWVANVSSVISEVTDNGATQARLYRGGLATISGSASGVPDQAVAPAAMTRDASGGSITLTAASTSTWAFDIIRTAVTLSTSVTGDAVISFDFLHGDDGNEPSETWT